MPYRMPGSMNYKQTHDCQIRNLKTILLEHIGYKNNGYFLEIGAFDGQTVSNTCWVSSFFRGRLLQWSPLQPGQTASVPALRTL